MRLTFANIDFDHPVFDRPIPEHGVLVRIVTEGGKDRGVSWFDYGLWAGLYLDQLFEFRAAGCFGDDEVLEPA